MPQNILQSNKHDHRFAVENVRGKIWAIPSIHGQLHSLIDLHDRIFKEFKLGDKIVYLGNYTGYSHYSALTIDEILAFRRSILTIQGVLPEDIIYLRGAQEEMLQKLKQIQFAPNPRAVLHWLLNNGLAQTLESYGICLGTLDRAAGSGVIALSRWSDYLMSTIRRFPGHDSFAQHYRRAALLSPFDDDSHTEQKNRERGLFVSGGLDFSKTLEDQGDALWWGKDDFRARDSRYASFKKVIRGFDYDRQGLYLNCVTATLDANAGAEGGQLICAELSNTSDIETIHTH